MPLSLRRGTVTAILERHEGLVRLEVDGRPCVAYPRLTGPVALADDVLVNVQAVELDLGSGGFDVLYANLTRGLELAASPGAHVMKLPYTPAQAAFPHVAGDRAEAEERVGLNGMPIVLCTLHSQVAPACAGIGHGLRVAYVQVPGGALPVSLSDAVRTLRRTGLLDVTVAVGACLDGEAACVSFASALTWAGDRAYDAVLCAIGPGIVGTASRFGHGALALADAANAALALGGRPVLAPRISSADPRSRHRGLSRHTREVLELVLGSVEVAWPDGLWPVPDGLDVRPVDVGGWERACEGLRLESMGRDPGDDPPFFAAGFAAGRLARALALERT